MKSLSAATHGFTDSVIRRMTRVALQYGSINLSQGFPDFDPPSEILDRLAQVAYTGPHQYALTWGAQNFREALAEKQKRFMGIDIDPDTNIVVTCGSTEAMMCAVHTVCDPQDKVVIFSPFYENYGADTILCQADPIYVPLVPPKFSFDPQVLEAAVADPKTKALILCNPSNPSGRVFTLEELQIIADLAEKYDIYVITDEVYEHIVYPPHKHIYFASLPGMAKRTLSCSSLSKTYSITGWRIGYIIAPAEIIDVAKKVHDFLTVGAPAPLMEATTTGLLLPDSYYEGLVRDYSAKRELFCNGLSDLGISFVEPEGAYYVMCDISEVGYADDEEFACDLARYAHVAGVPGSCFFAEPEMRYIRFHFAKNEDTLLRALANLQGWKDKLPRR